MSECWLGCGWGWRADQRLSSEHALAHRRDTAIYPPLLLCPLRPLISQAVPSTYLFMTA